MNFTHYHVYYGAPVEAVGVTPVEVVVRAVAVKASIHLVPSHTLCIHTPETKRLGSSLTCLHLSPVSKSTSTQGLRSCSNEAMQLKGKPSMPSETLDGAPAKVTSNA